MNVFVADVAGESTPEERFDRLVELPPSAKLVYTVLEHEAPLTQTQVIERSLLPPRTVRWALAELKDGGLIDEQLYVPDARKKLYRPYPIERRPE